jgi:hypothetical protein
MSEERSFRSGAADCSCNEPETQWHIMGMGSCSSYPIIRKRFSQMREDMMEKVGIPNSVQKAIMANHEPNEEAVYPIGPKSTFSNTEKSKLSICLKYIKCCYSLVSKRAPHEILDNKQRRNAWGE